MKSHRIQRQIKRNIRGDLSVQKKGNHAANADPLFHILAALVAIILPVSLIALAVGIVFRMPDFLAFEIDRSSILQELGLDTTPEEVANEISDYLRNKKDKLDLTTVVARKDAPVFSFMDEVNLSKIRDLLNKTLYPSIAAFVLSIILFVLTRLADRRRYLKYALRTSIVIYVCSVCVVLLIALYSPFREIVFAWQPGIEFTAGELLPQFYGGLYPLLSGGMVCLISLIIYIALYSIFIRFTVEKETLFR